MGRVHNLLSKHYICFLYNAGSEPQKFVHALREAISVVALRLFNLSFKRSGAEVCRGFLPSHTSYSPPYVQAHLTSTFSFRSKCEISQGQHGSLVEEFLNIKAPTEAQFTDCLLASRSVRNMKPPAEPTLLSCTCLSVLCYLDFRSTTASDWNNSLQTSNNIRLKTQTEVGGFFWLDAYIKNCVWKHYQHSL